MSLLQYITPSSLYNHLRNLWRNNRPDADVELARKDSDASTEEVTEEELGLLRQAEEFQLPAVVQTDINSWIKVANTLAITTALFAAVQISLAQIVEQSPKANWTNTLWCTLRWFCYSTVIINIGGTAAAISVVNMASSLSHHARDLLLRDENSHPRHMDSKPLSKHLLRPHSSNERLKKFGMPTVFFVLTRFMVVSFILGSTSIFVTFSLWVWATQSRVAASLMMPVLLPACWLTLSVIHY